MFSPNELPGSREPLVPNLVRFGSYTLSLMVFFLLLPRVAEHGDISLFKENGLIEWAQLCLLVLAGALFLLASVTCASFRQVLVLLSLVCAYAVVRELDAMLDQLLPVVGWKIGLGIPVFAAFYCHRHRHKLHGQLVQLLGLRAFGMLWVAFVVAVPFGQLVGNGHFLQMVMGDDYNRDYKRVIEELCELMGYMLIVIGSVETNVQLRAMQPRVTSAKTVAAATVEAN